MHPLKHPVSTSSLDELMTQHVGASEAHPMLTALIYGLLGCGIGFAFGTLYGIRLCYARNRHRRLHRRSPLFRPVPNPHPLKHPVSLATIRELTS